MGSVFQHTCSLSLDTSSFGWDVFESNASVLQIDNHSQCTMDMQCIENIWTIH